MKKIGSQIFLYNKLITYVPVYIHIYDFFLCYLSYYWYRYAYKLNFVYTGKIKSNFNLIHLQKLYNGTYFLNAPSPSIEGTDTGIYEFFCL